jgi:endoglucanase
VNRDTRWLARVAGVAVLALLALPLHQPSSAPRDTASTTSTRPAAAAVRLRWLASVPQAVWLTGGVPADAAATVRDATRDARRRGREPVFVVYDIPHRDCGGQSAGGAATAARYRRYVDAVARALSGPARVVLEPDSLAGLDCLGPAHRAGRLALLRVAVRRLTTVRHVAVYLDGGHRNWQPAATMARRLSQAGVAHARGFALNVSGYGATAAELRYGRAIAARTGWKRFVVDTSRNGRRTHGWCNPRGAAVGRLPGSGPSFPGLDARLWIKRPGESDGVCGTSRAPAGVFDRRLALDLLRNAGR